MLCRTFLHRYNALRLKSGWQLLQRGVDAKRLLKVPPFGFATTRRARSKLWRDGNRHRQVDSPQRTASATRIKPTSVGYKSSSLPETSAPCFFDSSHKDLAGCGKLRVYALRQATPTDLRGKRHGDISRNKC
jgi:hypothetical protein